jgi:hypothetical protein
MTWMDMIGFTISGVAALECVAGRLAQLDRKHHRPGVIAAYVVAACVCILAASLTWQGLGVWALDVLALVIAGHLVLTWEQWRHHPPASARQDEMAGMAPVPADSRRDGGR